MHTPYKKYLNKAFILLIGLLLVNQQLLAQETYPKLDQTQVQGSANRTVNLPSSSSVAAFNATRTYTPRVRINDSTQVNDNSSPDRVSISTTYSNGLGATIQTVQQYATLSAAGQYKHMVAPNDVRSKADPYSFLPFPSDVKDYNQSGPNHSVMYHNANRYPSESGVADEAVISTGQLINSSTQNERSATTYAPGKSRMGQGRGVKTTVITNTNIGLNNTPAANVKCWTLDASGLPVTSTVYQEGTLSGTRTESANGMEAYVLNDKSGKPVYEATLQTSPGGVKVYGVTYYVYDELERLRYIIPPKAVGAISVDGWAVSQAIIDELCFAYQYDADGRQHSIHKPGEQGYTELVYRKDGQLIMRRSPLEKAKGLWELVFYDKAGRLIATGLLSSNSDRAYWQGQADAQTAQASNSAHYYTWGAGKGLHPPKTGLNATEMLTYNYYDKYPSTVLASETYNPAPFQPHQVYSGTPDAPTLRASIYGFLAATEVKVLNNPAAPTYLQNWTSAKTFYDDYGRSIYAVGQNATGAKDSVYHQYNQAGQAIKKWHLRNAVNGGIVKRTTELETFNYEAYSGRLSGIWRSTNGGVNEPAVRYSYDEMGRMVKEVLGNDAETRLYTYNVRGELLGINENYALTGSNGGYTMSYGEALRYDYGFSFPRYDGMISGMVWRGSGGTNAKAHSYTYRYDSAGRMTSARYYEAATTGGVPTSWTTTQRNYSQTVAYDQNSNITAATRYGVSQNPSYTGVYQVDQLTYKYQTNSNKLKEVNDAVTIDYRTGDYQPGSVRGYNYDAGGNLTEDKSKKITNVSYTWFNKPQQVSFADGSSIMYTYDAGGSKLQEIVANGSQVSYTTYISGAVYKDTTLTYISTGQGRTNMTASPPRQEYFVKDHLDNVRSTVASLFPQTFTYNVGYELTDAPQEEALFENVAEIRGEKPGSTATDDVKAGLLKDDRQTGTSILLKVMAGDKFEINADNFYETIASFSNAQEPNTPAETIFGSALNSLAGGNTMSSAEGSSSSSIASRMFSNPEAATAYNSLVDAETDDSRPAAFLNFLFFDDEMKLMPEHSRLWQAAGENNWSQIGTGANNFIEMPQNGYVVVYISNQTQKANWFDNLHISFTKGILLEETHYYAYGLPIAGLSSQAATATKQRQRYQDNEYIQELGLNWMDFNNRAYDPQLGRFLGMDALADEGGQHTLSPFHAMGCDPVNMIDPLGLEYFAPRDAKRGEPTWKEIAWLIPPSLLQELGPHNTIYNPTDKIKERMLTDAINGYLKYFFGEIAKNTNFHGELKFFNGELTINYNEVTTGNDRGIEFSFDSKGKRVYYEGLNNEIVTGKTSVFNIMQETYRHPQTKASSEAIDAYQNSLDAVGMIPVLGEGADIANAALYVGRGDYYNASLSLFGGIPILGWVATGPRLFRNTVKATKFQKHHIIPNQVYKRFESEFVEMGWKQNDIMNLKKLPVPFHGNHPKYNTFIFNEINLLKESGKFNLNSMQDLQHNMRQMIGDAYRSGGTLNQYFKNLPQ
ncbi:RHS repeat-associated core domain-containing protein [Sphingobacterium multivorum]|uniref:RHS repeat-associated core domain-containing protein n=1 Tax=Sphingobacterium multivorum TaxID=28454 RepID=UPI0028AF4B1D|nr:RHS repeat-associated core domain-containing protein [Sphingobacterium multivorum]